jgi:hypothetical protein
MKKIFKFESSFLTKINNKDDKKIKAYEIIYDNFIKLFFLSILSIIEYKVKGSNCPKYTIISGIKKRDLKSNL